MKKPNNVQEYDGYAADIGKPLTPERRAFLEEQHRKHQEYLKSRKNQSCNDNEKKQVV